MTDFTRNTRTLIVCFSLAVFGLIPLRFLEVNQQISEDFGGASVLGETQTLEQSVVLPSADEYVVGQLEAPYNEIDGGVLGTTTNDNSGCMSLKQIDEAVVKVNEGLTAGLFANVEQADAEIQWLNAQLCK